MKKYLRAISLFFRIVFRDFHGARISIKTAYEIAKFIHFEFEYETSNQ